MHRPRPASTPLRLTALAAGFAVAVAGCGTEAADAATFLTDVEERCAQTNEEITALEEQFGGETPEDAIGYLSGWGESIDGFIADVDAMAVPEELAEGTDAVLAALGDTVAAFRAAAQQIEDGAEDIEAAAGPAFATLGPASTAAGEHWELSLESCGEEEVVADPDAQQVAVVATDYAFEIPPVAAGPTAFTMTNEGDEPHFMYIVRLEDGATLAEALEAEATGGDPEAFIAEDVGESSTVTSGMTAVVNAELTPGTYGMLCFVSDAEGTPHAALGMAQEFTVE